MRKTLTLAAAMYLAGCSTVLSETPPPKEYAPKDAAKGREGVVTYNPQGLKDLVDMRRKDAFKKIYEFCGSHDYKVTNEDTVPVEKTGGAGLAGIGATDMRRIHFVCQ